MKITSNVIATTVMVIYFVALSYLNPLCAQKMPVFEEIRQTLHDRSWYYGCSECRDKFDTAFSEVIEGSEEWIKLTNYYGGCLMEENRNAEAVTLWEKALEVIPDNYLFLSQIGTAYLRTNDLDRAEEYYEKSNSVKLNRIASYHLAHIHFTKGAGIDPGSDESKRQIREELLVKAEKEIRSTIDLYQQRKTENHHISRYTPAYTGSLLAHIKLVQGEVDDAQKMLRELIEEVELEENWLTDCP